MWKKSRIVQIRWGYMIILMKSGGKKKTILAVYQKLLHGSCSIHSGTLRVCSMQLIRLEILNLKKKKSTTNNHIFCQCILMMWVFSGSSIYFHCTQHSQSVYYRKWTKIRNHLISADTNVFGTREQSYGHFCTRWESSSTTYMWWT